MGMSDQLVLPQQIKFIDALVRDFIAPPRVLKIAYLGNQSANHPTVQHCQKLFPEAQHDFYDIVLGNWDINKEWKIEGYDLVVCYRTTAYVESSLEFFLQQLKKCISKNKYIIFDFTLYSGLFENHYSTRNPPGANARFDFRNLYKSSLRSPDFLQWRGYSYSLQDYFAATMLNAFTEKTFEENNIVPTFINCEWNPIKRDLITYAFWNNE